jgi:hypothetical protein
MFILSFTSSSSQVAVTRVWVWIIIAGVPVGMQVAWLLWISSGCPFESTRVVPVVHCAVTHGPLPFGGGGKVHPEIVNGAVCATVAMPPTVTRWLVTVGWA